MPVRTAVANLPNMHPRRQATGGASGQAEHLPLAAVAPNVGGGDCFYHALHGALTEQFHPMALHSPSSLREIVQKACDKARTRNIKLMSGETLGNFLREKKMTLADRTTLAGKPGWAGIAEAAVLAEELPISIEIWQHSVAERLWPRCTHARARPSSVQG